MKLSLITATHHRAEKLANFALPSVLAQTYIDFEWVIVNDGCDLETRQLVSQISANLPLNYLEMEHIEDGFSLCHARNLGLEVAKGSIVAYLDDDNSLFPEFVDETINLFKNNPDIKCSMPRANRRRDVVENGQIVREGKKFISPSASANVDCLILLHEIFDSNGFSHYRDNSPRWNPDYRIFADYEYFLQCLSRWRTEDFLLNPLVLVNYVQTNEGVIGDSNYHQWAAELAEIRRHAQQYSVCKKIDVKKRLKTLIKSYEEKHHSGLTLPGFSLFVNTKSE